MQRDSEAPRTRHRLLVPEQRRRVVVTGGSGALGLRLCRALHARGDTVVAVDKREPTNPSEGVAFLRADLNDLDRLAAACAGADVVIHTAALHGYHLPLYQADTFFANNVRGVFHVLTACLRHGIRKLVFTSSTSIYGASADPIDGRASWVDETTPVRWRTDDVYDATKVLGEELCKQYAREHDMAIIALRTTRFFFDDDVSYNVRKLYCGVDLRDVVQAHRLALSAPGGAGFRAYNIAARSPFHPTDAVELYADAPAVIERYYPGARELIARRDGVLPHRIGRVYDISKAERELDYRPRHNFAEFLAEVRGERAPYRQTG